MARVKYKKRLKCKHVSIHCVVSNELVYDSSDCLVRPDQINCLFHGSGGSIFLAFEKKILIG